MRRDGFPRGAAAKVSRRTSRGRTRRAATSSTSRPRRGRSSRGFPAIRRACASSGQARRRWLIADWSALTRDVFGVAIPVDGLASWIQAQPVAGRAFDLERDAAGRPLVLRQQGWEIVYAYADAAPTASDAPRDALSRQRADRSAHRRRSLATRAPRSGNAMADNAQPPGDTLVVAAPAKVNLFLHVTGRRADGYHLLESLFALIDFADTLTLDGARRRRDRAHARRRGRRRSRRSCAARRTRVAGGRGRARRRRDRRRQAHPDGRRAGRRQLRRRERAARAQPAVEARAAARSDCWRSAQTLGADVAFFVGGENAVARGIGER